MGNISQVRPKYRFSFTGTRGRKVRNCVLSPFISNITNTINSTVSNGLCSITIRLRLYGRRLSADVQIALNSLFHSILQNYNMVKTGKTQNSTGLGIKRYSWSYKICRRKKGLSVDVQIVINSLFRSRDTLQNYNMVKTGKKATIVQTWK